jgi:hypothetical protein
MSNTLLRVCPSDLKMPFELKKQSSAFLELVNKTDQCVAFKVKTTNPRKYAVRPASGVVPPRGSFGISSASASLVCVVFLSGLFDRSFSSATVRLV